MGFSPRPGIDAGLTLIEVLVAVVIMGIVFVAILFGMTSSIFMSRVHRIQANQELIMRNFAEAVDSVSYKTCANPSDYATASPTPSPPSEYSVTVTSIAYWDGNSATTSTAFFPSPSPSSCPPDNGLQEIKLRVDPPDGRIPLSRTIYKRCTDTCPP
jgi:prepilin-type N-terminal cleavage/methylation domain-containing protein